MLGSEGVINNLMAFGMASEDNETVLSDHRPQYVDINIENVVNLNKHDIGVPTIRRLKSSDQKCVDKYVKKTMDNFVSCNIL